MIDCDMLFMVKRDKHGTAVLLPTLISDDGKTRLVAGKYVDTAEKALSMYSGYTLAAAVEDAGGIEALQAEVEAREEEAAVEEGA